MPIDLYAACCFVKGLRTFHEESPLEGVTQLQGTAAGEYLHYLDDSLERMTFSDDFNASLERVTLPTNLQSLSFGKKFNQSLERVTLPTCLQSLTFG